MDSCAKYFVCHAETRILAKTSDPIEAEGNRSIPIQDFYLQFIRG